MVQVAIAMTCPKTPFVADGAIADDGFPKGDFREPSTYTPAEVTSDELDNVRKLIRELGL